MVIKNAIGLFILTIAIFVFFLPSYTKMQDLKQKNAEYKRQIEELLVQRGQLEEEKRLLEEDPVYLEMVGREKMGLIRPNEVVYKIMPIEGEKKKE